MHVPECSFLAVENFPLDFVSLLVDSDLVGVGVGVGGSGERSLEKFDFKERVGHSGFRLPAPSLIISRKEQSWQSEGSRDA